MFYTHTHTTIPAQGLLQYLYIYNPEKNGNARFAFLLPLNFTLRGPECPITQQSHVKPGLSLQLIFPCLSLPLSHVLQHFELCTLIGVYFTA